MPVYIFSLIFSALMIMIAALIANVIQYETGSHPKDPIRRKVWFWCLAVLTPVFYYLLGSLVFAPDILEDIMIYDEYMKTLPIATAVGFFVYIIIGFILSKIFRRGKIGNWF